MNTTLAEIIHGDCCLANAPPALSPDGTTTTTRRHAENQGPTGGRRQVRANEPNHALSPIKLIARLQHVRLVSDRWHACLAGGHSRPGAVSRVVSSSASQKKVNALVVEGPSDFGEGWACKLDEASTTTNKILAVRECATVSLARLRLSPARSACGEGRAGWPKPGQAGHYGVFFFFRSVWREDR
jgi:hypothetical protein